MDIEGSLSKIANEKTGIVLGFALTVNEVGKAGYGSFSGVLNAMTKSALTDLHFPNLGHVVKALTDYNESRVFKPAVVGAIAGYIIEQIGMDPMITKIGEALSKLGVGVALGCVIETLVAYSTLGHSPMDSSKSKSSPSENIYN